MNKTYQEALAWASSLLIAANIDPDGARYVLEMRAGFTPSQFVMHRQEAVPDKLWHEYQGDVKRLLVNEPPQYIVGLAPFFGDMFQVDKRVLIPRFETEELVAWAAKEQQHATTGLDLGTGSGAIGLTLAAQLPHCQMTLSDVSADALAVATANAKRLDRRVKLVQSDLFVGLGAAQFDFILANLPYIKPSEKPVMDKSTLQYEPALALFAGADGLALFRRFVAEAPQHLQPGGAIYLEFGYQQQPALARLFAQTVPEMAVMFRQDMAGHPRMVRLSAKETQ